MIWNDPFVVGIPSIEAHPAESPYQVQDGTSQAFIKEKKKLYEPLFFELWNKHVPEGKKSLTEESIKELLKYITSEKTITAETVRSFVIRVKNAEHSKDAVKVYAISQD